MGDAFTRPFWELDDQVPAGESPLERSKRLFIYALYNWYTFTGSKSRELTLYRVLTRQARRFDASRGSRAEKVADRIEAVTSKLKRGDEVMWLRLLMWLGMSSHMFGPFRDISPFAGKQIVSVQLNDCSAHSVGVLHHSFLQEIQDLCADGDADPEIRGHLVLIVPKNSVISAHLVKSQSWVH